VILLVYLLAFVCSFAAGAIMANHDMSLPEILLVVILLILSPLLMDFV
jgi:hypothetical protein